MDRRLFFVVVTGPLALTSCVAPPARAVPPAPVRPAATAMPARPVATPVAAVQPVVSTVAPRGNWTYQRLAAGSSAAFRDDRGTPVFGLSCRSGGAVVIQLPEPAATVTLRATSMLRTIALSGGEVVLTARDPLFDALAFSRGRFGVGTGGRETMVPAWPELTRVVEDCR